MTSCCPIVKPTVDGMTKTLTLIRHAKSSWKFTDLSDHDRPLNGRGRRDAPRMGERLLARGFAPDLMLVSTAVRARATAAVIAQACSIEDRVRSKKRLFHADPDDMLHLVIRADHAAAGLLRHVAVVAHNPGLTRLLEWWTGAGIDNLPTCGVATVEISGESFDAPSGSGRLVHYETPKNDPATPGSPTRSGVFSGRT